MPLIPATKMPHVGIPSEVAITLPPRIDVPGTAAYRCGLYPRPLTGLAVRRGNTGGLDG
jgi:hypothetical protein